MARKLIVGNWKMNPQSIKEAEILFNNTKNLVSGVKNVEVVICPPYPFLNIAKKIKSKKIILGAQNVGAEQSGAYTGEVSALMLRDMGVKYVIVGHSERRALGETNEIINKKIIFLLKTKLTPILCVGETVRQNDGSYLQIVKEQLSKCLSGIQKNNLKQIVIAYEPVWALSSTENRHDATPHDFEEMKIYIRKILADMFSASTAMSVRIIYGGSVNKNNALAFLDASADGLLPGKSSLEAKNFGEIVKVASNLK